MLNCPIRYWVTLAGLVIVLGGLALPKVRGQEVTNISDLQSQAIEHHRLKQHREALIARRKIASAIESAETADIGGPGPKTAEALGGLAFYALFAQEFAEALSASERALGLVPELAWIEMNRAHALVFLGRLDDARQIYRAHRGKVIPELAESWEKAVEGDFIELQASRVYHPDFDKVMAELDIDKDVKDTSTSIVQVDAAMELMYRLRSEKRYSEALAAAEQRLQLARQRYSQTSKAVANATAALGLAYDDLGQWDKAEQFNERALDIAERALGPNHRELDEFLEYLAKIYTKRRRYAEAEQLYKRQIAIVETIENQFALADRLERFAKFYFDQGNWTQAIDTLRRSVEAAGLTYWTDYSARRYEGIIRSTYQLGGEGSRNYPLAADATFVAAQWALPSQAAELLAQMAARGAKGNPELALLVRQGQDLKDEHLNLSVQYIKTNDAIARADIVSRQRTVNARLENTNKRLEVEFPDYSALTKPLPLGVQDVKAQLRDDEVLVLFLDTRARTPLGEETFIWVVTKNEVRWVRTPFGTEALKREVAALRCGLDATNWADAADWPERDEIDTKRKTSQLARRNLCRELTGIEVSGENALPFDPARAHALYKSLLGEASDLIRGKQLLIVPSGALTTLPFQVLVTEAPKGKTLPPCAGSSATTPSPCCPPSHR